MMPSLAKIISPAESDDVERSGHRNTSEALWAMVGREIGREHQNKHGRDTRTTNKTNTMQTTLCWAFLRPREKPHFPNSVGGCLNDAWPRQDDQSGRI